MIKWYNLHAIEALSDLERAGRWFLVSGIQEPTGGVARYHLSELRRNAGVSTEITGYAVSFYAWMYEQTRLQDYLEAALKSGRWLVRTAWDSESSTFPFEPVASGKTKYSYFFDCGIIVRGLLALWRASGESEFLDKAKEAAVAMAFDFHALEAVHPIITLPTKEPVAREPRWSRSPGCYQLKSALAWREVGEASGQPQIGAAWDRMLRYSLDTHDSFLPGDASAERVMDRLHAYCYFLEALLAVAPGRTDCAEALATGIQRVGGYLRAIAPLFERSDVNAQLLRVRVYAHQLGIVPMDTCAAAEEAESIAGFQSDDADSLFKGGYWFGRKGDGFLPYMNPVSTAFCAQALEMWRQHLRGQFNSPLTALV